MWFGMNNFQPFFFFWHTLVARIARDLLPSPQVFQHGAKSLKPSLKFCLWTSMTILPFNLGFCISKHGEKSEAIEQPVSFFMQKNKPGLWLVLSLKLLRLGIAACVHFTGMFGFHSPTFFYCNFWLFCIFAHYNRSDFDGTCLQLGGARAWKWWRPLL